MPWLTELVNEEAGMTSRSCRHLNACSVPSPPLLPSHLDHKAHPRGLLEFSHVLQQPGQRQWSLAWGSVPPLSTNPFSSEGQLLWVEGQRRRCEPRPAVHVWIPINSQKSPLPVPRGLKGGKRWKPLCRQVGHWT